MAPVTSQEEFIGCDVMGDGLTKYKKYNDSNHNHHEDIKLPGQHRLSRSIPASSWKSFSNPG